MGVVVVLVVLIGGFYVWRFVRLGRSIGRFTSTVRQRQADKAAGKPVRPISLLAVAGLALVVVGVIVARTTNGIVGLGMMAIGLAAIVIGSKAAQAKLDSLRQQANPQQHGWNLAQPGYVPPGQPNAYGQGGYPQPGYGQPGYVDPGHDYGQHG